MSETGYNYGYDNNISVNIRTGTSTRAAQNHLPTHQWVDQPQTTVERERRHIPIIAVEIIPSYSRRRDRIGNHGNHNNSSINLFRLLDLLQLQSFDNSTNIERNENIVLDIEKRLSTDVEINTVCSVCQETFKENEYVSTLDVCCHTFHHKCIEEWGYYKQECPLCREEIYVLEE